MVEMAPDSRKKLIQTAGPLFAERGLDGVSTRDITQAAEVNISLISYYFGGKEGLYKACIEDFAIEAQKFMTPFLQGFETRGMTRESFLRDMRRIVEGIVRVKLVAPYMPALMMREVMQGLPHAKDIHERVFSQMGQALIAILKTAQTKKIVKKDIHLPTLLLSMVHATDTYFLAVKCESSFTALCYKIPDQVDEYIEQVMKIFVEGALV